MKGIYSLNGVELVYDVDLKLENYTGHGVLIIRLEDTSFEMIVTKNHLSNKITAFVNYNGMNHSGQYEMSVQLFPDNGYMQLLVRQVWHSLFSPFDVINKYLLVYSG